MPRSTGLFVALVGAFSLGLGATVQAQDDPAFGYWLVESKRAVVQIAACDGAPDRACGAIVWLVEPVDDSGAPRTDVENPEESLRARPLCGLQIIGDFKRQTSGNWEDGFIYDASEGDMYDAWMEVQDNATLKVRGYVGVSLFRKSQTWTRETSDRGGC